MALLGSVRLPNPVQPSNANVSILDTELGIMRSPVKPTHPLKLCCPIYDTDEGIVRIPVNAAHPLNVVAPIVVILHTPA